MTDADVDMAELTQAAAAAAAGGNSLEGADDPSSTERPPSRREDLLQNAYFDVERGVKLASFAFSIYGKPTIDHWYNGHGGTKIGLTPEAVHKNFKASLKCHVLRAEDLPKEASMVDYLMSGERPDPYVLVEVKGPYGYAQGKTPAVQDSFDPVWENQVYDLLIADPATAELEVVVKDEHRVGKSVVLGKGVKPLSELELGGAAWKGWVALQDAKGHPAGSVELSLELTPTVAPQFAEDEELEDSHAPQSTDNLDWATMASKVTDASLSLKKYRMVVFFSNDETDTQGGLWWRPATKELMIVFRGTEITSLKDVLTDMNITQKPLDNAKDARLIHSGFHAAFNSVVGNVYECVEMVLGQGGDLEADGWTVDCSGHSLGGALASLMAHSLAHKYPTLAKANRLHMYSFGAPRVGNKEFCEDFNAMLGHSTFRVVNGADVVPRMPPRSNPGSIVYDHFGWTILITEESLENISIYLEGQLPSDAAPPSPQKDVSDAIEGGAGISQAVAAADAAHPEAPTTIDKMLDIAEEDPTTLGRLLTTPKVGAFERAEAGEGIGVPGPLRRGSIPVSASAEPGAVIEDSLLKGKVGDHTETSYFEAIQKAFAALMKDAAEAKAAAGGKEEEEERA